MQTHFCKESPCPVQDAECATILQNGFKRTYTLTPLEQFNEEVKNDLYHHTVQGQYNVTPLWLERFITQKLTTHKELILKMVREKVPKIKITGEGTYCQTCRQHKAAGECDCIGFNKGVQEFLNNLDTI